ncbi:ferritin-like domain-containing protein [Aliinostoc sp. HNIBRCY26]|uniref:YciE/YciF ferroxidase family protein n=1 Tax=Aliinostoc sp. HNIBRCY26 TaxID=3418997 RepID=UPI003D00D128
MVQLTERPVSRITNLQEKFVYEICAMYDAEQRFWEAQQMMLQCCQNSQLKSLIETHIRETEQQIQNLEQVFNTLGQQPKRITCDAAAGLVSDGQKFMLLAAESQKILTLGLAAAQAKVEQLEIACYRGLIQVAEKIGKQDAVKLLQQNLQQEEQTAKKLEQHMPELLKECK